MKAMKSLNLARTAAASARPTVSRIVSAKKVDSTSSRMQCWLSTPPLRWAEGAAESAQTPTRMPSNTFAKKAITFAEAK